MKISYEQKILLKETIIEKVECKLNTVFCNFLKHFLRKGGDKMTKI